MSDAFFRAGVGAVVLDQSRRILVLRRKGIEATAWQLPQGGIGADERPLDALQRELHEETNLTPSDVEVVRSTGEWWVYELPAEYRNAKVGWGQAQLWFLCKLLAPRTSVRPDQVEFAEAAWVTAGELLSRAVSFRLPTYQRLVREFGL
jgi:putative (di)nucleoside polyphosphate hydrolase